MTKLFATVIGISFLACGGAQPPAEGADDAATEAADSGPEVEAAPEEAAPRNDGIVRDADGDGVPDDAGGGCEGKNETQCQITAGCAWSDTGECVDAGM